LHDVWALTGGCHYTQGCERYAQRCGHCPVLGSEDEADLSRQVWSRKRAAWDGLDLTLIASSRWMEGLIRSSALLRERRVEILPNCVETDFFRPVDKAAARAALALPQNRRLLLFGALTEKGDRRKGYHLLVPALQRLAGRLPRDALDLAVMGLARPDGPLPFPFETHYLGVIRDDAKLALAYAAADVLIAPSLEDNLPYMVMEAMSCGTPCVAFAVSGLPDLIDHGESGYLARPFEVDDLARGIESLVMDDTLRRALGDRARQAVVERFAPAVIARRHLNLYEDLLRRAN
jgi:glycosyltransferase involved in cell wall biosynthesis